MASKEFNDGFNEGILNALALCVAHGDCGSTYYEELLRLAGEDEVIAYARKSGDMRWSGLSKYLRGKKEDAAMFAETTP